MPAAKNIVWTTSMAVRPGRESPSRSAVDETASVAAESPSQRQGTGEETVAESPTNTAARNARPSVYTKST